MGGSSASEQAKVIVSSLLGFALAMLVIAAFRAADPVVGQRWQQFIELVILVMVVALVILGMLYARQFRRQRRQLRRYYTDTNQEQPPLPVQPASFMLTQPTSRPS